MAEGLFAQLDCAFPDDPEIIEAGYQAELAYVRCVLRCREHLTDGVVDRRVADRWLAGIPGRAARHLDRLVEVGKLLVHEQGWVIPEHAWRRFNPTKAEVEAKREAKREAGLKGNHDRWHGDKPSPTCAWCRPPPSQNGSQVRSQDVAGASRIDSPEPEPEPEPEVTPPAPPPAATNGATIERAAPSPPATDVEAVFDAWREATGHHRAVLDPKRRRLITARLREYPTEDLVDAVRGWKHSAHHRGENDRRTVYDDIELLLRDAAHVERFRDLERGGRRPSVVRSKGGASVQRALERREVAS